MASENLTVKLNEKKHSFLVEFDIFHVIITSQYKKNTLALKINLNIPILILKIFLKWTNLGS